MSSVGGGSVAAALYAVVSNPAQVGAVPEDAQDKKHHLKHGKGFVNPWDSHVELSPFELFKGFLGRKLSGKANHPDTTPPTVAVRKPSFHPTRTTPVLRSTWLGHACYYVEFPSGLRVLFDPVFEDCCAPINLKSLRRYTPPPCEIEDLPFVDAVLISHNHYDHLSYPTIQRIVKKYPDAHFFAPLGNRAWFLSSGVKGDRVHELDWWESRDIVLEAKTGGKAGSVSVSEDADATKSAPSSITATISALPCQHASARTGWDKNHTLWASWSISSPVPSSPSSTPPSTTTTPTTSNIWFAGDTGYRTVPRSVPEDADEYGAAYAHLPVCPAFKQIGALRGPFDLGLIPIGAYAPRWMFSNVHAGPKDAVCIFEDTGCRRALGMHWGTWVLTEEDVLEPPRKLKEAMVWKGLPAEGVFDVCEIGESREFESGAAAK
ncbi:Metallo-hydrolase/oxidoreductase [Pyrenochaeta sp. DS3sAY3a]|nr:Metallo-hydrolase/oxidoreductase [Pyrenochaeta sp. DS3sAY3a]